jgi:hypothetical protein
LRRTNARKKLVREWRKELDLRYKQHLVRNQGDAPDERLSANLRGRDRRERRDPSVGSAGNVVCTATVCSGRVAIGGALEDSWIYVKWPFTAGADRGAGFVTSERVARDENGEPNFPSAENQYEGAIVVHSRLQFGSLLHRRIPITITLI